MIVNLLRRCISLPALLLALLLMAGCAASPSVLIEPSFKVNPSQEVMPVLPFTSLMVPEDFSESVFNNFIDILNDNHSSTSIKWFTIIKEDMKDAARLIPPGNLYMTGELWSYIENSGCCSTELRVKARVRFYRSGSPAMLAEIEVPLESFFEHDSSTLTIERDKLSLRLAREMAQQVLKLLHTSPVAKHSP